MNGEILDIHSYMSVHLSEIIKDCKPFCQPNKCQNGARCVELWSNYKCVCENKWAHFGDYCENSKPIPISTTFDKFRDRNNSFRPLNSAFFFFLDINNEALTFTSQSAFLKKNYFGTDEKDEEKSLLKNILMKNILINLRTYDTYSSILYANDNLNNFAHLYISNGTSIVYLFNAGNEIKNITVEYPGN